MAKIRVENEYHDLYKALSRGDSAVGSSASFETMKHVFMFALGIGASRGERLALGGSPREIFDDNVLNQTDWDVIRSVCLADESAPIESIEDEAKLVGIAMEFANAGIRLLRKHYQSSQPEQSLANLVLKELSR